VLDCVIIYILLIIEHCEESHRKISDTTLFNERHSTLLHVSFPQESS